MDFFAVSFVVNQARHSVCLLASMEPIQPNYSFDLQSGCSSSRFDAITAGGRFLKPIETELHGYNLRGHFLIKEIQLYWIDLLKENENKTIPMLTTTS